MAAGTFFTYVQSTNDIDVPYQARPSNGMITFRIKENQDKVLIIAYLDDREAMYKMVYEAPKEFQGMVGLGLCCARVELLCFLLDFVKTHYNQVSLQSFLYNHGFKRVDIEVLV